MERNDLDIRREQERVAALTEQHKGDGEFVAGFLQGAQQALRWVLFGDAPSASERVATATERAELEAVGDELNAAAKDGMVEIAGYVDGEPQYRMTDQGRADIEAKLRAAGVDPTDKDAVLRWMKGE